jgi:hypothetical protein
MRRVLLATLAFAVSVSISWGHLTSGSLKFSRQGPYHPGDTLTISFRVGVIHGNCNIDLRLDGKKWTSLKANLPAPAVQTYTYKWTVGTDTTSRGKIRICQLNGSTCTDADSTDDPDGRQKGSRYVLISQPFTIAATSAILPGTTDDVPALSMSAPGAVDIAFSLVSEGMVNLTAYDARGRETAVLLNTRYPAGSHRLSLFSEALRAHPEWILRLNAAGHSQALHR